MSQSIASIDGTSRIKMYLASSLNAIQFIVLSEHVSKFCWYSIIYKL